MNNSTTESKPIKRFCKIMNRMCELATEFRYCQLTACIKKWNKSEIMSDLISRQDVLDSITASINQFGGRYTSEQLNMWGLFTQMIQELPSALGDVPSAQKQKKGKWIEINVKGMNYVYCSECEDSYYPVPLDPSWNFCPHCGVDMRGNKG